MSRLTLVSPSLDFAFGRKVTGARTQTSLPGLEASVLGSLNLIAARDWDALFPEGAASYDLHRAFEAVPRMGYTLGCIGVHARGRLIAAAPLFQSSQTAGDRSRRQQPSIPVLGLGSPMTDRSGIGIASHLDTRTRGLALAAMVGALNQEARRRRSLIVSIKGVDADAGDLHAIARKAGFGHVTAVPSASLAMPFRSLDAYFASLAPKQADKLRRIATNATGLTFEFRRSAAGLERRLVEMCRSTEQAEGCNDDLHPGYFTELLSRLGDGCKLMLVWTGEDLAGFQMFRTGGGRLIADRAGVAARGACGRQLRLAMRLKMIEHAIANALPEIELGPLDAAETVALGGTLERRWLYFRFTNGVINRFALPLRRLLDAERNDPIAKALALTGR